MDIWINIMEIILSMVENKIINLSELVGESYIILKYKRNITNIENILCSIHHYLYVKYYLPDLFFDIFKKYKLGLDTPYESSKK